MTRWQPGAIGACARPRERCPHRLQALAATESGWESVGSESPPGPDLVVIGAMSAGQTTAVAAISAVVAGEAVAEVLGRGTVCDDIGWQRKVAEIEGSVTISPPRQDPLARLATADRRGIR